MSAHCLRPTSPRHKGKDLVFLPLCCRWGGKAKEQSACALLTSYDGNSVVVREGATPSPNYTATTGRDLRVPGTRLWSQTKKML